MNRNRLSHLRVLLPTELPRAAHSELSWFVAKLPTFFLECWMRGKRTQEGRGVRGCRERRDVRTERRRKMRNVVAATAKEHRSRLRTTFSSMQITAESNNSVHSKLKQRLKNASCLGKTSRQDLQNMGYFSPSGLLGVFVRSTAIVLDALRVYTRQQSWPANNKPEIELNLS